MSDALCRKEFPTTTLKFRIKAESDNKSENAFLTVLNVTAVTESKWIKRPSKGVTCGNASHRDAINYNKLSKVAITGDTFSSRQINYLATSTNIPPHFKIPHHLLFPKGWRKTNKSIWWNWITMRKCGASSRNKMKSVDGVVSIYIHI